MIVLDTNIVIYYFKGETDVTHWLDRERHRNQAVAISTLTIVEALGYTDITPLQEFFIEQWLRQILTIDVDATTAREAARIRRGYGLKAIDSVIAATAIILHADLVSKDKIFQRIGELHVIPI